MQRFHRRIYAPAGACAPSVNAMPATRKMALALAEEHAWVMATRNARDRYRSELCAGARSEAHQPDRRRSRPRCRSSGGIGELGLAYLRGMRLAGMAATHQAFSRARLGAGRYPRGARYRPRSLDEIRRCDLIPFADAHRGRCRGGDDGTRHLSRRSMRSRRAIRAYGFRTSCAGSWDFAVSCSATTSAWRRQPASADVAGAFARTDVPAAIWCWSAQPGAVAEALIAQHDAPGCDPARIESLCGKVASTWQQIVDNPQRDRFISRVTALDAHRSAT